MTETAIRSIAMILLAGGITFGLRALPFFAFGKRSELPPLVAKLAATLPCAIMAVLVVYCLKSLPTDSARQAMVTLLACAVVSLLHLWQKNTLLSVFAGTVAFMVLLRLI